MAISALDAVFANTDTATGQRQHPPRPDRHRGRPAAGQSCGNSGTGWSRCAGGLAQLVLPGKPPMHGQWTPLPKGYHIAWIDGPKGEWQIRHEAGKLVYIDPTGGEAGTVTRIEPIRPWN